MAPTHMKPEAMWRRNKNEKHNNRCYMCTALTIFLLLLLRALKQLQPIVVTFTWQCETLKKNELLISNRKDIRSDFWMSGVWRKLFEGSWEFLKVLTHFWKSQIRYISLQRRLVCLTPCGLVSYLMDTQPLCTRYLVSKSLINRKIYIWCHCVVLSFGGFVIMLCNLACEVGDLNRQVFIPYY